MKKTQVLVQACNFAGLGAAQKIRAYAGDRVSTTFIGDIGSGKGFYIHFNAWFGGNTQVLQIGHIPYIQKIAYKELFFRRGGKVPNWDSHLRSGRSRPSSFDGTHQRASDQRLSCLAVSVHGSMM